ncbi:hypothetical protein [Leptospira sp. GIMC2001]|uniref:hypothetical protein n=1 Tax=Leptospira sp. GIMC2001 TaxID=1513297 RepID=UPI00234BC378|nr:hypothetical protein [Leptospira sp. GIMC2001]WCL50322.1 hypothetical protein O4O04_05745 [Leptospira sp. GIMC2001]
MSIVDRIFNHLSNLSIDVCFGALGVGYCVWVILGIDPPFYWWIILPLSVFTIYNADHIWDVYNIQNLESISKNPRRHFHYRYRLILTFSTILSGIVSIILTLIYAPIQWFYIGLGLGIFCCIHFVLIKFIPRIPKEIIVATIYTMGVFIIPSFEKFYSIYLQNYSTNPNLFNSSIQILQEFTHSPHAYITLVFLAIIITAVVINLLVNAYMDYNQDILENFLSLANRLGIDRTKIWIQRLSAIGMLLSIFLVYLLISQSNSGSKFLRSLIIFPLLGVFAIPNMIAANLNFIVQGNRYRYLGEWSFAGLSIIGVLLNL